MVASFKCALSFMCLLVNFKTINGHRETGHNAIYGIHDRAKRQAGYVYDKPSISFNLPSRNPIVSTSTQASPPVDRTSMQMYYAYPAPVEGDTVNIGFNSATSAVSTTPTSVGVAGYNYAAQNTQSGSIGNIASGGTSGGANGYNYNVQNTQMSGGENSERGGAGGSNGYNYGVQSTVMQNTGAQNTGQQNIQAGSIGSVVTGVTSSSGGYNYGIQSSGSQVSSGAGSSGYNTQVGIQNSYSGNTGNAGSTGYGTQSSIQNSDAGITTGGVSTNAPKYLPPSKSAIPVTGTTVSTPIDTVSVSAPSDSYLPPSDSLPNSPAVTVTQTVSNIVPSINIGAQTYNTPASAPNTGYLSPNTGPNISNIQNNQAQATVAPTRQPQPLPTTNYLPPIVSTQGTVSTPASSYLPPVF